jgi:hypothetical protein
LGGKVNDLKVDDGVQWNHDLHHKAQHHRKRDQDEGVGLLEEVSPCICDTTSTCGLPEERN